MNVQTLTANFRAINWRERRVQAIVVGCILVIAGLAYFVTSREDGALLTITEKPTVTVGRVGDLMSGGSSLSVIAEITSISEAKISPETGGKIVRVRSSLGDFVSAGQVLAEIENSSQRANLLQAEGAYDAAKAARSKVQGGTRDEQIAIKQSALKAAQSGVVNTLLTAYSSLGSAINDGADPLFTNPAIRPSFNIIVTTDSAAKLQLENERTTFTAIMTRQSTQARSIAETADLKAEMTKTETELRAARVFMDVALKAVNAGVPSTEITQNELDAYKADVASARTSLTTSLSAIAAARGSLETAEKSLEEGVTGAVSQDLAASDAAVKQAQGAYNAALANLEKNIIRTPISGTLNNFTVKLGDTVSPAQQIAIVSNNGALEARVYITEEDKLRISVGKKVTLEGGIAGTITKIAPALDPVTRRIEVRIGLSANAAKVFSNGESVRVELANETGEAMKPLRGPLSIPLTALRMESGRNVVFTVNNDTLVVQEISIGRLSGDSVQVEDGLDFDSEIVVDARGRKEGEGVIVVRN